MLYEVVTMYRYKPEDGSLLFKYMASISRLNTNKIYDLSVRKNHANIFTSLTLKQSPNGGTVFNFNGLTNIVLHPTIHFQNYEEHTYSVWLCWVGNLPTTFVIPFGQHGQPANSIYLAGLGGATQFSYRPQSGSNFIVPNVNTPKLYDLTWNMLTWAMDKTRHIKVYINGKKSGDTVYIADTEIYYTGIGAGYTDSSYLWQGKMNDIRLYNRVLSASDIMNLYNQTRRYYGK